MRISYSQWVRFQGQSLGMIWQTDDTDLAEHVEYEASPDGVLVAGGRIVTVSDQAGFSRVASRFGIDVHDIEVPVVDLDVFEFLGQDSFSAESCSTLLDAWNLYGDIVRSIGGSLEDQDLVAKNCYDKLFYGCNLASVTPEGEHYTPLFTAKEKSRMLEVFNRGAELLSNNL